MALTDIAIRKAKPREKQYKLADEKGLFLLVHPNGSKYWRFKYYFGGKPKGPLALGVYPDVSLAEARDKRDEARKMLSKGTDPGLVKKLLKYSSKSVEKNSFEAIGREWFAKYSPIWKEKYAAKILRILEKDIFAWLGNNLIHEITPPVLLTTLQRIEGRGSKDTAHRVKQYCGRIFRFAIASGRAERDPSRDLDGALSPPVKSHFAAITDPQGAGELLRAINGYRGEFVTQCALRLIPLVFVRSIELRTAEWSEFYFEAAEWRIPAHKMKMKTMHIVPLSKQAISILLELQAITGDGKYLFPSVRSVQRPMSDNTVLGALRRLGFTKNEMTGHGFRSMASTLLNEQGWNRDAIERQLAHVERNKVRAAYNYAEYLPERRKMMQYWADYLDSLKNNTKSFLHKAA